jgi:hypothetical protein
VSLFDHRSGLVFRTNEKTTPEIRFWPLPSRFGIGPWLKDPNPAFDGSTPLQVIERGETDRIWRMVYELESGEPA